MQLSSFYKNVHYEKRKSHSPGCRKGAGMESMDGIENHCPPTNIRLGSKNEKFAQNENVKQYKYSTVLNKSVNYLCSFQPIMD